MVRTLPLQSETRPELPRILGIATVIAVHAFAFLLLLIPMATPPLREVLGEGMEMIWIEPKKEAVVDVPIKKEPKPVTEPKTTPKTADPVVPVVDPPVIVEGGSVATNDPLTSDPGPVAADPGPSLSGPVTVGSLGYVRATPPPYPRVEAHAGIGGTVLLKVLVDVDGRPLEVVVLESSGNRSLDRSAREHVLKNWLFQPAMRDGHAVQAYGKVPVVFSMQ